MQTQDKTKSSSHKKVKSKKRWWLWLLLVVILLLVVFLLVPVFVSSEKGRKMILAQINNTIAGQVDFNSFSMSWFKGIKLKDINFNNDAGDISVSVKQIAAKPYYASILAGKLSFGETIIEEPKISIDLQSRQLKRSQELSGDQLPAKESKPLILPIKKIDLTVNDGGLKVTDYQGQTSELSSINSNVNLRPPGQKTDFNINMNVSNGDKGSMVSAEGRITPNKKTGWTLAGTSGDLSIEVNDLQLTSLGPFLALAGIEAQGKGSISTNIQISIEDGRIQSLQGTLNATDLDISPGQLKGDRLKSKRFYVDVKLQKENELLNIENLLIRTDWANVTANGYVPTTLKTLTDFLTPATDYKLQGGFEFDLAAVLSQMPRTFGLREGMKITSGKFNGDIQAYQGNIQSQASLFDLAGIVDNREIALSEPVRLETKIISDESGITFEKLGLSASFAKVDCSGTSKLFEYNANLDLQKLQAELGQFADLGSYQMIGQVFSKGKVSAAEDKITADGFSQVKNLRLSSTNGSGAVEPQADMDFSVTIEPKQGIVKIGSANLNASFGQFGTKDADLLFDKKAPTSFNLPVTAKVDLQKIQPFLVLLASFPKQMQMAGVAESQINISSKKDSYQISTEATKITNLKVKYPEQESFEQQEVTIDFDAEINPLKKTLAVRNFKLLSPQIKIQGDFQQFKEGARAKFEGKADLEYDWASVSTMAGPFLPEGLKLQGQRKDTIILSSEYPTGRTDQLLANLNAEGKAGFEKAEYMGLNFGPTDVDIKVKKGLLTIAPFSTTVNNGQLNFACDADFNRKPTLLKTPEPMEIVKDIELNDEVASKLLASLNPLFAGAVGVRGIANLSCQTLSIPITGGGKEDVEIEGTVSLRNINMRPTGLLGTIVSATGASRGQDMTIHPTAFSVSNSYVRYDNMQMDIGDNPINFSGNLPLDPDEKIKDFTITLPYTSLGETISIGDETSGKRMTVHITGTPSHPELDLGKLLQEQLRQQLEEKLLEGLHDLFK